MPFTPSHIAAALPFLRTPLPVAPLVIGTMAPDVPYFLPLRIPRDLTHSLAGVPTVDLAITIVLVLLWYAVLRPPVVDLLPAVVRERMLPRGPLGWRPPGRAWLPAIGRAVLASLLGILTHLAWDAFTHQNSPIVRASRAARPARAASGVELAAARELDRRSRRTRVWDPLVDAPHAAGARGVAHGASQSCYRVDRRDRRIRSGWIRGPAGGVGCRDPAAEPEPGLSRCHRRRRSRRPGRPGDLRSLVDQQRVDQRSAAKPSGAPRRPCRAPRRRRPGSARTRSCAAAARCGRRAAGTP